LAGERAGIGAIRLAATRDGEPPKKRSRNGQFDRATSFLMIRTTDGNQRTNPLVKVANDMIGVAGEFGFSPAARASIAADIRYERPGMFDGLLGGD
jgi:hypothetical protein